MLHTGFSFAQFKYIGNGYGDQGWHGWHGTGSHAPWDATVAYLLIHQKQVSHRIDTTTVEGPTSYRVSPTYGGGYTVNETTPSYTFLTNADHNCPGFFPVMWPWLLGGDHQESFAAEVAVHALFFSIRLGWNPWYFDWSSLPPKDEPKKEPLENSGYE